MYLSCTESHFKMLNFNLLVLTSFEVTTVTTIDSQELILNKVGANMQLPYKAHFGGTIFDRE